MQVSSTYRPQNQLLPQGNLSATVPYTFSAKEKDSETSLSYFGVRYYTSDLSIWLSVDPMSAKYPSFSPYTYCANNPIKLVDPNGEEIGIPPFLQRIVNGIKNKYNQVKSKFEDATHEFFSTIPYASPTPLPSTINNDFEAMNVYFNGTGEPMSLSNELGNKVISTEQFQKRHQRILNGETTSLTGNITIDMTKEEDAFFIGRTRVDYDIKISSDKKRCTVTYTLFSNDGFGDPIDIGKDHNIGPTPDGAGPKRELPGGHPYSFKTQTRSYEFDNPGYDEK